MNIKKTIVQKIKNRGIIIFVMDIAFIFIILTILRFVYIMFDYASIEYEQQVKWAREEYLATGFGRFYSDVNNIVLWSKRFKVDFNGNFCDFGDYLYDQLSDREKLNYIYGDSFCYTHYNRRKILPRIDIVKDENIFEVDIDSLFGKEARKIILEEYQMSDYKTKEPCTDNKCFMYIDKNGFIGKNKDSNFMDNFIK